MNSLQQALTTTGVAERKFPTIEEVLARQFETRREQEDRIWYEVLRRLYGSQ